MFVYNTIAPRNHLEESIAAVRKEVLTCLLSLGRQLALVSSKVVALSILQ